MPEPYVLRKVPPMADGGPGVTPRDANKATLLTREAVIVPGLALPCLLCRMGRLRRFWAVHEQNTPGDHFCCPSLDPVAVLV